MRHIKREDPIHAVQSYEHNENNIQKTFKNFGVVANLINFVNVKQSRKEPTNIMKVLTGICTNKNKELINLT